MVNHNGLGQLLALKSRLGIPPIHKLLLIVDNLDEYVLIRSVGLCS